MLKKVVKTVKKEVAPKTVVQVTPVVDKIGLESLESDPVEVVSEDQSDMPVISPTQTLPSSKSRISFIIIVTVLIITLVAVGASIYFYSKYKNVNVLSEKITSDNPENKVNQLVETIGKLIELPKDEVPTVATVSDTAKLADQAFFKNAKNGDSVLIYSKSGKAILFRPSTGKIIEVGPINVTDPVSTVKSQSVSAEATGTPSAIPIVTSVKVVIFNGTKTAGLAGKAKSTLSPDASVSVVTTGNSQADHENSLIIDLTGKQKARAESLAKQFKGKVGSLPVGETKPDADILIILGTSYVE